jgi:hypothetical protein
MFHNTYENRLQEWSEFRNTLEISEDPIQQAINKYKTAPTVSIQTDPWSRDSWPSPWELILENQYCDFCKLLGVCYSLQLTSKFSRSTFEIHITVDRTREQSHYLLFVDQVVIGYDESTYMHRNQLPATLQSQLVYTMQFLN